MLDWFRVLKGVPLPRVRIHRNERFPGKLPWFSPRECERNPHSLYLFQGNSKNKSHSKAVQAAKAGNTKMLGQAVIRGQPNAHEVEVKNGPSLQTYDYFHDGKLEKLKIFERSLMLAFAKAHIHGHEDIVVPANQWVSDRLGRHNLVAMDSNTWHWHDKAPPQKKVMEYILGRQHDIYSLADPDRYPPRSSGEIRDSLASIGMQPAQPLLDSENNHMGHMLLDDNGRWVFQE